jgi:general secretion pathway protein I
MVALIIAGLAAAALLRATGNGLHATRTAAVYDQALVRAKSHLAAATHGTRLTAGNWAGDDGGGFRWHLHVAPVATASVRPVGPATAASVPVVLYDIEVWIECSDGRQVHLETQQVG